MPTACAKIQIRHLVSFKNNLFPMRVFAQVKFLASSKNSFTSREGEYVEYSENVLKGDNGLITLNSKANYEECEGKEGVAEIEATEIGGDAKGYKLTLKRFVEGEKIEVQAEDVE